MFTCPSYVYGAPLVYITTCPFSVSNIFFVQPEVSVIQNLTFILHMRRSMTVPVTDESEAMRRNTQTSAGHHHLPEATRSRFGRAAASLVSGCISASAAYFKSMELVCMNFISIVELFVNIHIYCICISTL